MIGCCLAQELTALHAKRLMVTFDESDELAQDQEIESVAQARGLSRGKRAV